MSGQLRTYMSAHESCNVSCAVPHDELCRARGGDKVLAASLKRRKWSLGSPIHIKTYINKHVIAISKYQLVHRIDIKWANYIAFAIVPFWGEQLLIPSQMNLLTLLDPVQATLQVSPTSPTSVCPLGDRAIDINSNQYQYSNRQQADGNSSRQHADQ